MWNFFQKNHSPYNLRQEDIVHLLPEKSTLYGVNSVVVCGSLL